MANEAGINILVALKDQFTKGFSSLSKSVTANAQQIKNAGNAMTLKLTTPIVAAGGLMIKLASDAQETQSKFNTVFKGMEDQANSWAESFANDAGRAVTEIKKFQGGLGDILKPLGFATDEAQALSGEMVELALDVASFNNRSDADVINAFTSALTGERDALKSLGIVISEADVKAEAYRAGLAKEGEELSKTAKAQATYNLLLANTSDAQGDLARTQDSAANQMKRFSANMQNLAESFGQILLPTFTQIVVKLNDLVLWFGTLGTGTQQTILVVAGLIAVAGPLVSLFGTMITVIQGVGAALIFLSANPIILIIGGIVALGAAIYLLIQNWELVRAKAIEIWTAIQGFFVTKLQEISAYFTESFSSMDGFLRMIWDGIKLFFQTTWYALFGIVELQMTLMWEAIKLGFEMIGIDIQAIWDGIKAYFEGLWTGFVLFVTDSLNNIASYVSNIFGKVRQTFSSIWEGIKNIFINAWTSLKTLVSDGLTAIKTFVTSFTAPISEAFGGMWGSITNVFSNALENIKQMVFNVLNWIIDKLNAVINKINTATGKAAEFFGGDAQSVSLPTIPRLADGGIVTSPTLAMIGEAGAEAVVPLTKGNMPGMGTTIIMKNNVFLDEYAEERIGNALMDKLSFNAQY